MPLPSPISPYQRALGADFDLLAPQLRERLSPPSDRAVGHSAGIVTAGSRSRVLRPLLSALAARRIAFPGFGTATPVSVTTVPGPGEGLSRGREFLFPGAAAPADSRLIEDTVHAIDGALHVFLGRSRALETAFSPTVTDGGLTLVSTGTWLHAGRFRLRIPAPIAPRVVVSERWVDDALRVESHVTAPFFGQVFEYAGSLDHTWR
ncbi:MAG: DUF4166 domain-containing protein [Glaciihabitans sp.]